MSAPNRLKLVVTTIFEPIADEAKVPAVSFASVTISPLITPWRIAPVSGAKLLPSYCFPVVVPVTVNGIAVMFAVRPAGCTKV